MPNCDEDDCVEEAAASCPQCAVIFCTNHGGGDGNECPDCSTPMVGFG